MLTSDNKIISKFLLTPKNLILATLLHETAEAGVTASAFDVTNVIKHTVRGEVHSDRTDKRATRRKLIGLKVKIAGMEGFCGWLHYLISAENA